MPALSVSRLVSTALIAAAVVAGQSVQPSNATLDGSESQTEFQLGLDTAPPTGSQFYTIAPLTADVGKGADGQTNGVQQTSIQGAVTPVDDQTTTVGKNDIAYISCDPTEGNINASSVVGTAAAASPKAIVLYSLQSQECDLNGSYPYTTIYTMISSGDSSILLNALKPNGSLAALISFNSSSNSTATSDTTPGGPPPTTAVAMSILYSITGIITLLFLIVIASGAIRAHRHPERYGPRAAITGRSRQSRAKGLARAMLETLPIVKFGDPEPVKPGATDIELEDGTSSMHNAAEVTGAVTTPETEEQTKNVPTIAKPETEKVQPGSEQAKPASEAAEGSTEGAPTGELGCSICTEDFTTGEDVRVLPCHHKYHPACIDPWLLNVSGTCPLCRHDLRPVQSTTAETAEGDELPPPLGAEDDTEHHTGEATTEGESSTDPSHRHRLRMSRLLDLTRLRTAPPEERIAALRQLREQSQQEGTAAAAGDQQGRSAGLTSRLRDKFHIRTRTENSPE